MFQGIVYPVLPFVAPYCSLQSVFIKDEKNMNSVKWGYIDARFSFIADMNADGAFTISDIWEWFKWVYFAPGDLIAIFLLDTSIGNFLEVSWESLSGTGSGVVSLVLWLFLLGILLVALDG